MIDGIASTGTDADTALVLTRSGQITSYDVQSVPAGSGIRLPSFVGSDAVCMIRNSGSNYLNVYPSPGGTIDGSDSPYVLTSSTRTILWALSALDWVSFVGS